MIAVTTTRKLVWPTIILLTLSLWLGGCLLLDCVIMPSFYLSGMMTTSSFASAGYLVFGLFNRIEVLCAALVITSSLGLRMQWSERWSLDTFSLGMGLLTVTLLATYLFTPEMSALSLNLNYFSSSLDVPPTMNSMHVGYWCLEGCKFLAGGLILKRVYEIQASIP
jgi:uncharacterized membrane protein